MNPVHKVPPNSLTSVLVLPSHPRLDLPSGLFPLGFPIEDFHGTILSSMRVTCPAHQLHLDLITLIIEI